MVLKEKTALITGATSGIGRACAETFAARGCGLVLVARRLPILEELAADLRKSHGVPVHVQVLDVRDRKAVFAFGEELAKKGLVPDVLVNNAGLARGMSRIQDGDVDEWEEMIDTNLKGLLYVTRAVLPLMVERDYGHVVNIGSVAGKIVYPMGNVYNGTKFAVEALNQAMNLDLVDTAIRVSVIEPGMVNTNFSAVRFDGDQARADAVYQGLTPLSARDIADAVLYVVEAPDHVNIQNLTIMPTAQRNSFVVNRKKN